MRAFSQLTTVGYACSVKGGNTNELAIAVTEAGEARLLKLTGEFDLAGVALFERRLHAERGAVTRTAILDLRDLAFIDSSGLRALIQADLRLRDEGARLILVKGAGQVEDVLALTGLAERLELADDVPADLTGGPPA